MITDIEMVVRVVLALVFGGLIGLERETDKEPAGLRTHMLVCLGATLFTIISFSMSDATPDRIASNIVVGIGFLGAGAIFKDSNHVKGLTTAADLWVIAAIGMAIGYGYYLIAIVSTIIALAVLVAKKMVGNIGRQATMEKRLL